MTIGELLNSISNSISSSVVGVVWFFNDMINKVIDGKILDLSIFQGILLLIPTLIISFALWGLWIDNWERFGDFLEDYCEGKWVTPKWIKFIVVLFLYLTLLFGLIFLTIYLDSMD